MPSRPSTSKPPMRTLAISRIWVNLPPARSTSSLSVSMEPASASSSVISDFLQAGGSRRVRRAHFGRQLDDGLRNRTYGDQDRHQTGENDGCQQRQHNQQRIVLEREQRAAGTAPSRTH